MFEIVDIKNTKLIFSRFDSVETVSLGLFFKTGSRFENQSSKGIAHFLEHMVFKGSRRYSHLAIKRAIEGKGGSLNAFTSQEVTAYYAHILNKNILAASDILFDMAYYPLLAPAEIEKERKVILEEIKMYNDLPASRAVALLDKLLWPEHPLGEEVLGYNRTVGSITNRNLNFFQRQNYTPDNMIISVSGNVDRERLSAALRERMQNKKKSDKLSFAAPAALKGVSIKLEHKQLEQIHLCCGFRSYPASSARQVALRLLNIILGANMSSRLFEELRERRSLCYDVSTEIRKYKDSGGFIIHTGLAQSMLPKALTAILKVLRSLKDNPVGKNELGRAKDYLLGQMAMTLESPQGRMFYFAEQYLTFDRCFQLKEIKEEIAGVSAYDIQCLAKELFNKNGFCLSCVGNVRPEDEQFLRALIDKQGL